MCTTFLLFLLISVNVVTPESSLKTKVYGNYEEHNGTERLNGLVILCTENERNEKMNLWAD